MGGKHLQAVGSSEFCDCFSYTKYAMLRLAINIVMATKNTAAFNFWVPQPKILFYSVIMMLCIDINKVQLPLIELMCSFR